MSSYYSFHAVTIRVHVRYSSLCRSKYAQSPCLEFVLRKQIDLDHYVWTASIQNARLGGSKNSLSILTPTRARIFVSTDPTTFRVPSLFDQKRPRPLDCFAYTSPLSPPSPVSSLSRLPRRRCLAGHAPLSLGRPALNRWARLSRSNITVKTSHCTAQDPYRYRKRTSTHISTKWVSHICSSEG